MFRIPQYLNKCTIAIRKKWNFGDLTLELNHWRDPTFFIIRYYFFNYTEK